MRTKSWIVAVVVIALITVGAVYYVRVSSAPLEVKAARATRGDISDVVTASGVMEPDRVMPVVAKYGNEVEDILVGEGAWVDKDQDVIEFEWGNDAESPLTGMVVKISTKVGQSPPPGTVLMTVADMNPTYVIAKVDETDVSRVKRAQAVRIFLDAYPKKKVVGRVVSIGYESTITEGGGTAFPVKTKIIKKDPGVTLRLGMNADVEIVTKVHRSVVLVPADSVTRVGGKDTVYVVAGDTARATAVKIGFSSDESYEIVSGVAAGDLVITSKLDELSDGTKVKVGK